MKCNQICQICGGECVLEKVKGVGAKVWKHKKEPKKAHPPYPKLEWTKAQAKKDYTRLKKEFKEGWGKVE